MVTSPYEWKILEWDDKPQTNKKTSNHSFAQVCLLLENLSQMSNVAYGPLVQMEGYAFFQVQIIVTSWKHVDSFSPEPVVPALCHFFKGRLLKKIEDYLKNILQIDWLIV